MRKRKSSSSLLTDIIGTVSFQSLIVHQIISFSYGLVHAHSKVDDIERTRKEDLDIHFLSSERLPHSLA